VLAFYLTQQEAVDAYLKEHAQATTIIRQELQTAHAAFLADLRHRLTARGRKTVAGTVSCSVNPHRFIKALVALAAIAH
jgi:hypothetical protein